jgi:hypothetical protein
MNNQKTIINELSVNELGLVAGGGFWGGVATEVLIRAVEAGVTWVVQSAKDPGRQDPNCVDALGNVGC